jgi:transposase InsO family protein
MNSMKDEHSVHALAEALEVSPSGFFAHQRKAQGQRRQEDGALSAVIVPIFAASRQTYGCPRVTAALRQQGVRCGKNRVARLMRENRLVPRQKRRRWRPMTTNSNHVRPVAENWLARVPAPARPDQVWVADITYIDTGEGWLYLAGILDACTRRLVGWQTGETLDAGLVTQAWQKAVRDRRPPPGLLHHSDRGVQYASGAMRVLLARSGAAASMSRRGNCYDNATMESFWATLKAECFAGERPATRQAAKLQVFDYIEGFYNRMRLHSSLGYRSPLAFEQDISYNKN